MTQIKQREQQIEDFRCTTVHFRNFSDIIQPTTSSDVLHEAIWNAVQAGSAPSQTDAEVVPEDPTLTGHNGAEVDPWDKGGGDGEAGGVTPSVRSVFELAETNVVSLREPSLHDLLSDMPVPGVVPKGPNDADTARNGARTVASKSTKIVAHVFEF
ncbi:hypothetical protein FRC06_010365 [Ceratobasidium sp. 370]|nr:hypothetical protein FRC06_010365 [Ceratobasidium sp. 370]